MRPHRPCSVPPCLARRRAGTQQVPDPYVPREWTRTPIRWLCGHHSFTGEENSFTETPRTEVTRTTRAAGGGTHRGTTAGPLPMAGVSVRLRVCPLCPDPATRPSPGGHLMAHALLPSAVSHLLTPELPAGPSHGGQSGRYPRSTRRKGLEPRTPRLQRRRVPRTTLSHCPPWSWSISLRGDAWRALPC